MPPEPVPAEPEWDDDPAWSRPDPMTAAELEAGLDRVCEQDEPLRPRRSPGTSSRSPRTSWPRSARPPPTSCSPWRRPPPGGGARASPAPRGSSPASRPARRPRSGPGMPLDVLPGCAALAVAADAAAGRGRRVRRGVGGRAGRGAVRVGPGRGPRRRPQARRLGGAGPPQPRPAGRRVHRGPGRVRAGRVPRPGRGPDRPGPDPRNPAARHRRGAGRRDHHPVQGRDHRPRHRPAR